jgi:hypothetical protein
MVASSITRLNLTDYTRSSKSQLSYFQLCVVAPTIVFSAV